MTIKELVQKYIENTLQVLHQTERRERLREEKAQKVWNRAKRYLEDAVYYRDQKRFETALASVAYCEGLLDALKLLGMVEFQWPKKRLTAHRRNRERK